METPFRPCQLGAGDVKGFGQDGGHGHAEGGRGGRHRGRLPEVRRRHQGARGAHEEHGEIYILESLPLPVKNHYGGPNTKIFGFNNPSPAGNARPVW